MTLTTESNLDHTQQHYESRFEHSDDDCLNTNLRHDKLITCHCGRLMCKKCQTHLKELVK